MKCARGCGVPESWACQGGTMKQRRCFASHTGRNIRFTGKLANSCRGPVTKRANERGTKANGIRSRRSISEICKALVCAGWGQELRLRIDQRRAGINWNCMCVCCGWVADDWQFDCVSPPWVQLHTRYLLGSDIYRCYALSVTQRRRHPLLPQGYIHKQNRLRN